MDSIQEALNFERADFCIGDIKVFPQLNKVETKGVATTLEPRLIKVLVLLASHAPEVVSKAEIMAYAWPNVHVMESSLTKAISDLRIIFGDDPQRPHIIETIRKKGYRLLIQPEPFSKPIPAVGRISKTPAWPWILSLAVVLAGIYYLRPVATQASQVLPEAKTSLKGKESTPAINNLDDRIAFVHVDDNLVPTVRVKNVHDQSEPVTVLRGAQGYGFPTWSPYGESLAVVVYDQNQTQIVQVDGQEEKVLASWNLSGCGGLAWSHEYLWISLPISDVRALGLFRVNPKTGHSELVVAPEAGEIGLINPCISKSGQYLGYLRSFAASHNRFELFDLTTGAVKQVTFGDRIIFSATFGPEDAIYFAGTSSRGANLFRSFPPYDSWETYLEHANFNPLWPSAGSSMLVFENDIVNLGLFSWDGSQTTAVANSSRVDYDPSLQASSGRLCFISNRSGSRQIWLIENGTEWCVTKEEQGEVRNPRWHPTENKIAYLLWKETDHEIRVVDVNNQQSHTVLSGGTFHYLSLWDNKNRLLVSPTPKQGIFAVDMEGNRSLVCPPGAVKCVQTGDQLYYNRSDKPGIFRNIGEKEDLVMAMDNLIGPGWHFDGEDLYWASSSGLFHQAVDDSVELITELKPNPFASGNLVVHPESKAVIFDALEEAESDIYAVPIAP